jgi:hypothetical protein
MCTSFFCCNDLSGYYFVINQNNIQHKQKLLNILSFV